MHIRDAARRIEDHPPGTVGVYTDNIARFSDFTVSITGLQVPDGTIFSWSRGVYLAYNTNRFIREMQGDWLFLMDDDHRFEPDILKKLLDHDLDVVCALTSKKFPPYEPVIYKQTGVDVNFGLEPIKLEQNMGGLLEVDACGKPGMLIRKHVLDAISDPWCEFKDSSQGAEDMDFCTKIKEAGFKIHCDLDTQLAHMAPMAVYKVRDPEGRWGSSIVLSNDSAIFVHDS